MRVAIVGSRGIEGDLTALLDDILPNGTPGYTTAIVSGGARGVDRSAEAYADAHGIEKIIFYPNYKLFGKKAPLMRNYDIIDNADMVIAIWDGVSRGTAHSINYAIESNKTVVICNCDRVDTPS
jgi:hypothetical protein